MFLFSSTETGIKRLGGSHPTPQQGSGVFAFGTLVTQGAVCTMAGGLPGLIIDVTRQGWHLGVCISLCAFFGFYKKTQGHRLFPAHRDSSLRCQ